MQFVDQLQSKVTTFTQDRRKVMFLACVIVGLMLIGMIIIFLAPRSRTAMNADGTGEWTPTPTYTIEEVQALTLAPPKPTDIPFIKKEDLIIDQPTSVPTPLPGPFYIANGQQNDLIIRLVAVRRGDTFAETRLINQKTTEQRLLGYIYDLSPGDSAFFSSDFSQVIFVGGPKADYQKINFYSIPQNKIIKSISLEQMRQTLTGIEFNEISVLSNMMPSPDKTKVAISYGLTFNTTPIHPKTQIIIINLNTNKMQLLPVRGLVKQWKDDTTLEYETQADKTSPRVTQEVKVTGI